MQLEPVGCGARNVKECLLAQLEANGEGKSLAYELVRDHLEDLQPHRLQHLSKDTGVELNDLKRRNQQSPHSRPLSGQTLFVRRADLRFAGSLYRKNRRRICHLFYRRRQSASSDQSDISADARTRKKRRKKTKDFIKDKVRSAVDLLRNIEHRKQTIYRVVECIVQKTTEFLDHGVQHIKPMMLKDVAEDIGMHLSTISRVVNRKYAHTPQGVIELRRFFSEGMLNEDGEEVSTRILKLRIKKMIEEENTKKPMTDDQDRQNSDQRRRKTFAPDGRQIPRPDADSRFA